MPAPKQFPRTGTASNHLITTVEWVGAPAEWTEKESFQLSTSEFGDQTLTRDYWFKREAPIHQLKLPNKGDYDRQYKDLKVFDSTLKGDGPWYHLNVRLNGFLDRFTGPQVREKMQYLIREQTVYASQITASGDTRVNLAASMNVRYIAPSVVRRYTMPTEPKFRNRYEAEGFDEDIQVIGVLLGDTGVIADLSDFKRLMSAYDLKRQLRSIRTQLEVDLEGAVYHVTEVIERQIIQEPTFKAMFL
jgi:hypothetical protein